MAMSEPKAMSQKYRVQPGTKVKLAAWDPDEKGDFESKAQARKAMEKNLARLAELEYLLYAENKRSVLIVLQAMDAGGKDGTIRHVMGPLNPQSCKVTSFKAPSVEELSHDFLWRVHQAVPRKGQIGIFNRSHYEDVLVVRVRKLVEKRIWSKRYRQINDFERMLSENGVHILKFYLHISKAEQLKRLQARLDDPNKHWKITPADAEERRYWDDYMAAFEEALTRCSTDDAPWYIIPANYKWYRDLVISEILVEAFESYKMAFPKPTADIASIRLT
jgi:PPK2 family polyphosphate:nucleotide phosphotransferase